MKSAALDAHAPRALSGAPDSLAVWWAHARWPLALFLLLAALLALTDDDLLIARELFFDANSGHWLAAHSFWVNDVIHTGGRWLVRGVILALLAGWALTSRVPELRSWQWPAAYACLAMLLAIAMVGLLKRLTNVDCPWDLDTFGGQFPFVPLFADRPDSLPRAHCFPAAHASSGYALVAFYFALRERSVGWARCALVVALATGLSFGIAQQARGAHFLSHDLWSAFIAWMCALTLYTGGFIGKLGPRAN